MNNNTTRQQIEAELSKIYIKNIIVIDWGRGGRPVARYIHHENCEIITVDSKSDCRADLVADMCKPLTIKEADMAFCLEALEHCYDLDVVLDNIYNNLKINGKLFISAPFIYPRHGHRDYWRFTELGIKHILSRHKFKILKIIKLQYDIRIGYFIEAMK